jgi:tetratricopeptide (TPR) repeat protein
MARCRLARNDADGQVESFLAERSGAMNKESGSRRGGSAPAAEAAWPASSGRLPVVGDYLSPRPETGYGLDGPLASLPQGTDGQPGVTVLVGPGGHGKTYLAAALAANIARAQIVDLRVWVTASSPAAVVSGYAAAAADIGLARRGIRQQTAADLFLDWLRTTERPWLVVLDDMTDSPGLRGLWPAGAAGQVVVTCHQSADLSELAGITARICRISGFSPREALSYLSARLYDDAGTRAEAVDLAADLGFVPLALDLAVATMAAATLDCRQYRIRLATRKDELASRAGESGPTPDDGSAASFDAAWSLALERAEQRPPGRLAGRVLALAALLDPAGVPATVLTTRAARGYLSRYAGGTGTDEGQVFATLGALAQSGLVSIDQAAGSVLVGVHPLIGESTRRLLPRSALDAAARAAADALMEGWPPAGADPVREQQLRGCACWIGAVTGELLWSPQPHPVLLRTGTSMTDAGMAGPSVAYWTSLLQASTRLLGLASGQTLALRDRLAQACEAVGRIGDAMELMKFGVAEREQLLGRDHPDTLTARVSLARAFLSAGLPQDAIDAYERVTAECEWVLGVRHPDTMSARSQLAAAYSAAGRTDKAISVYERNLADWERALGPEHREVLTEWLNLGTACQSAGRLDEAVDIFSRVRSTRERILGPGHEETVAAASRLALAYRKAERLKEAIALYRQVVAARESALGPDHADTVTALANLASCYHAAHRMKDAIPVYERVLATTERVSGPDHPDTLTARGNVAGAYHSAGRLAQALPVYEQTLADFDRVLGPDHPDTLTSRANLANAYYMARRQSDAIRVYNQTIADCERALGYDHPLTRAISDNLKSITSLPSGAGGSNSFIPLRCHAGKGKVFTKPLAFY